MIGTHTVRVADAKLQQDAIRAEMVELPPANLICSGTVNMRKRYWALPRNAADMKSVRERIASGTFETSPILPEIKDPSCKQLLIPGADWENDEYIAVSPAYSCGVLHELYHRIAETNGFYRYWTVQPTPAAFGNHGEMVAVQGGRLRVLRRGVPRVDQKNRGIFDFVRLRATVSGMNLSGGMITSGWPAISAIGGLVHSIERKVGEPLSFAYGQKKVSINRSATWAGNPGGNLRFGKSVRAGQVAGHPRPTPGFRTTEITGTADIELLIRGDDHRQIAKALRQVTRIAGGSVFNAKVTVHRQSHPPRAAAYMTWGDIHAEGDADPLDFGLAQYNSDGMWIKGQGYYQADKASMLSCVGYGLLEKPTERAGVRGNYPHAWAESLIGLIKLKAIEDESCWWTRKTGSYGVYWTAACQPLPTAGEAPHDGALASV